MHRHHATYADGPYCYTHPVRQGQHENPSAHGDICWVEHCNCGAKRLHNQNGGHHEVGAWRRA